MRAVVVHRADNDGAGSRQDRCRLHFRPFLPFKILHLAGVSPFKPFRIKRSFGEGAERRYSHKIKTERMRLIFNFNGVHRALKFSISSPGFAIRTRSFSITPLSAGPPTPGRFSLHSE